MADTLTANRSFWYRGKMRRKGDEFEPRRGDVEYLTSGGNPLATQGKAKSAPAFDPAAATKEELEVEAERRGIEVKGTGKDGNVLVSDLRAALG